MTPCTGVASAASAREMESGRDTSDTVMPGFRLPTSSDRAGRPRMCGTRLSTHWKPFVNVVLMDWAHPGSGFPAGFAAGFSAADAMSDAACGASDDQNTATGVSYDVSGEQRRLHAAATSAVQRLKCCQVMSLRLSPTVPAQKRSLHVRQSGPTSCTSTICRASKSTLAVEFRDLSSHPSICFISKLSISSSIASSNSQTLALALPRSC